MPRRELPPTAGLPFEPGDFLPGPANLARRVATTLHLPPLQLECSGTASLLLALHTLQRLAPQRRVVVVPAYTCPLVAIAVHRLGLELRLCDLRPGHYDMDPQALADACREDTLAVLPTHLAGRVADVDSAMEAATRHGAWVIEDAAQALGARDRGRSVGLRGHLGFFSLAAGKGLSIYEGGLLVTRDRALREALRQTSAASVPRRPGWELRRSLELLGLAALYRPLGLRPAYGAPLRRALRRGDPAAAVGDIFPDTIPLHRVGRWRQAVGARAAMRLPAFLDTTRTQARERAERLRRIDGVHVFGDPPEAEGTWPVLWLRLPDEARRDAALRELWQAGLGVSRLFVHALPDYPYLADRVPRADVPHARDLAARTLTLGNSAWLDEEAFEAICAVLERMLA
ncbi:DegT/DnrJ/EryC1/StrS family aminotransferase [Frateuria defendens]|uniref:DegT/DnrJ/EryC1/StrS family aminotransferase n=1 Tax=Frateuria defendens TaxID=2219559 RepID=UPI00066FF405|nr:DegT/DnrJ/EryC1/StrS family aminotransferase [Frateuria defendens]